MVHRGVALPWSGACAAGAAAVTSEAQQQLLAQLLLLLLLLLQRRRRHWQWPLRRLPRTPSSCRARALGGEHPPHCCRSTGAR